MKWKSPTIIFNKSWKRSRSTIYNTLSYFKHKEHKHEIYLIKRYKKVHYTYNRNLKYFCSKYFATKVSPIYKLNLYLPRRNPNYDWLRKKIARLYRGPVWGQSNSVPVTLPRHVLSIKARGFLTWPFSFLAALLLKF